MLKKGLFFGLITFITVSGCHKSKTTSHSSQQTDSSAIRKKHTSPLSPTESLSHFSVEEGLDVRLVAAEPLVRAPVSIKFDDKDRIWAVEMQGYMRDTTGAGKQKPSGKIVILEDQNHNGIMDQRKVFLDSLVLPRSIGFYGDGVLVAAPPNLWFVENNNDKPGKKILVDSTYAVGGNVEHQPNGLLRGIDNWIYSANSTKRYRRINGRWISRPTHFRGQWGLTQGRYGRLFYNNNSANLLGDYFLPSLGAWNPHQQDVGGFNKIIVPDNRTYPIHPTPGVNRGYRPGVLDDSSKLVTFTAASGPAIYRDDALGKAYQGNAFVAGPAANLVKRNILRDKGFRVTGQQAYQGKEFLASDDERFRPVEVKTGPAGALYVVDMYRGVIQDVTYLTSYLRDEIGKRHLQHPLNRGRIYKVVPEGKSFSHPDLSRKSTNELVRLLDDTNGWVRTTAQRLLTDHHKVGATERIRNKLEDDMSTVGRIHALWTLEGIGRLQRSDILRLFHSDKTILQQEALSAAITLVHQRNADKWIEEISELVSKDDRKLVPYIAFFTASIANAGYAPKKTHKLMLTLASAYKNNRYASDALISGLTGNESSFLQDFHSAEHDTSLVFYKHLQAVVQHIKNNKKENPKTPVSTNFPRGKQLFSTYCQACHGADGNGIRSLGAPLNGSSWVTGQKRTLISIVLYGLNGPIKIGDKVYKKPEVAGHMPGFGQNSQLSDTDVANILSYIRNAWANEAGAVDSDDVKKVRQNNKGRKQPFTAEELK